MAEDNEKDLFTTEQLDFMSFQDRLNYYKSQKVIDISQGLNHLLHDSAELMAFMTTDFVMQQGRITFIGTKDNKIYMLGHDNAAYTHAAVLANANIDPKDVSFSTSIEGRDNKLLPHIKVVANRDEGELIRKGDEMLINLGRGSDTMGLKVSQGVMNENGLKNLTKIFGDIEGTEFHIPIDWGGKN